MAWQLSLVTALLLAPAVQAFDVVGAAPSAPTPTHEPEEEEEEEGHAECAFDALLATTFLAKAGTEVNEAAIDCPAGEQKACASDVAGILASFISVASFVADAGSRCAHTLNMRAQCTADITGLFAALSEVAASGAGVSEHCGDGVGLVVHRRLQIETDQLGEGEHNAELAACVVDANEAALFLGKAGLEIHAAVTECPEHTEESHTECTASVSGVVGSFTSVASFLATMITSCPGVANKGAACTGEVTALLATIADLASSAAKVSLDCLHQTVQTVGAAVPGFAGGAPARLLSGGNHSVPLLSSRRLQDKAVLV